MSNISIRIENKDTLQLEFNNCIVHKTNRKIKMKLLKFDEIVPNVYVVYKVKPFFVDEIIKSLMDIAEKYNLDLQVDKSAYEYVAANFLNIREKQQFGMEVKLANLDEDSEYIKFSEVVNNRLARKLYLQQMEIAYHAYKVKRSMNFSVPGSGKTSMVYGLFAYLNSDIDSPNYVNKVVVLCPKNAFKAWVDEFKENFGNKLECHPFRVDESQKVEFDLYVKHANYNLVLINYERVKGLEESLENILTSQSLIVFDEIHRIKNFNGVRGSHIRENIKSNGYMCALTGTPMPNGYNDLKNMMSILFSDEYELMDFSSFDFKSLSDKQKSQINENMSPFFSRITKSDLKMPPYNQDYIINVELTDKEHECINIVKNKKYNAFVSLLRFNQVLSAPRRVRNVTRKDIEEFGLDDGDLMCDKFTDSELSFINSVKISSKMIKLVQLVTALIEEKKSVVIWCQYIDSIDEIKKLLCECNIIAEIISGAVENQTREKLIDKFNNNEFSVLITNPQTLAESVSLHKVCHDAIYFELNFDLAKFLQSKDRIHRLGIASNQYTQYYFFNCEIMDDVYFEEKIMKRLSEKEIEMNNFLNSDEYIYALNEINSRKAAINVMKELF